MEFALIGVQNQAHPLKYPVTKMFGRPQISLEHQSHPHRIPPTGSGVDRGAKSVLQLQAIAFNGNHHHYGKLFYQHLGQGALQTVLMHIPSPTLKIQAVDVAATLDLLVLLTYNFRGRDRKTHRIRPDFNIQRVSELAYGSIEC